MSHNKRALETGVYVSPEIAVPPSSGVQNGLMAITDIPWRGEELWFAVNVSVDDSSSLSSGSVTFGDNICLSNGTNFFPMVNQGFKTVGYADIPKVSNPPLKSVVSFFGQLSFGRLGITNATNGTLKITVVATPRRFVAESV